MNSTQQPPAPPRDRLEGLSEQGRRLVQEVTAALQRRDAPTTMQRLSALRALAPKHPEVLRLCAAVARLQGRNDDAIALLREAVAARPSDALVQANLAHVLADSGALGEAISILRRCSEVEPAQSAHRIALAQMLERNGDADGARAVLHELLQREPGHVPARLTLARMLYMLGRGDAAATEFRAVLAQAPDSVAAWYGLSTLQRQVFSADDVAAIERIHARSDLADSARASIGFALARAYEHHERHADAWKVLLATNATWRRRVRWDAAVFSRHVRAIADTFAAPANLAHDGAAGAGLVFIVGLPRTGSSIVEQILAAHPDVAAGGELEHVTTIIRTESERRECDFPGWVAHTSADDWSRLGRDYLERIATRRGERRVFTDKGLMNWLYLGALRAMLPGARFIDCRRDPLETCLACFRQMFAKEHGFTYDLAELATFWHDYEHAMRHWRTLYPDAILEVRLEQLAAEPEAGIRRLLDFCGLAFDERVLRFHEFERSVHTLSADQVREPLRTDTARAHRYGNALDPLRERLANPGSA